MSVRTAEAEAINILQEEQLQLHKYKWNLTTSRTSCDYIAVHCLRLTNQGLCLICVGLPNLLATSRQLTPIDLPITTRHCLPSTRQSHALVSPVAGDPELLSHCEGLSSWPCGNTQVRQDTIPAGCKSPQAWLE